MLFSSSNAAGLSTMGTGGQGQWPRWVRTSGGGAYDGMPMPEMERSCPSQGRRCPSWEQARGRQCLDFEDRRMKALAYKDIDVGFWLLDIFFERQRHLLLQGNRDFTRSNPPSVIHAPTTDITSYK